MKHCTSDPESTWWRKKKLCKVVDKNKSVNKIKFRITAEVKVLFPYIWMSVLIYYILYLCTIVCRKASSPRCFCPKWLNTSQFCSAWAVLCHSEIPRSPLSSEAHRASPLVPPIFRVTYRTAVVSVNLVEIELIGLMKPWVPQDIISPASASPAKHTYLQGFADYTRTRSSAAFVSRQGWRMMAWDQAQLQSIVWVLWERQVRLRRRCKGCTTLSAASFQHLWWCPVFKPLSLPSQMLCSFPFIIQDSNLLC